ncbi:MAG: hypothetical protein WC389_08965 [Lutibacter sp.]|jgi:hypothetical protein
MELKVRETLFDTIIGIDPGMNGAIAFWKPGQLTKTYKMPSEPTDMVLILKVIKERADNPLCFIEYQGLQGRDIGGRQFGIVKMLKNFERLKTTMSLSGIQFIEVHSRTWQGKLNLRIKEAEDKRDRKNRYKKMAKNLFPECKVTLTNCDALLLVQFGRWVFAYDKKYLESKIPIEHLKLEL